MLSDLEFAREQYRQLLKMANYYAENKRNDPDYDSVIEICVDGMADCLARIRELEKNIKE